MKRFLILVIPILFVCCDKEKIIIGKQKETSIGKKNSITLVINDDLWNSVAGDSIRKYVAQPVSGMINYEPIFDITQVNHQVFSEQLEKSRNILYFKKGKKDSFTLEKSVYATPQNCFTITYTSQKELTKAIAKYSDSIIKVFHALEVNEEQHYINRVALHNIKKFNEKFGISIKIPRYYHLREETMLPFLWYQKDLPSGDVNIIIYEWPFSEFNDDTDEITQFFQVQNWIGENYIRNYKNTGYYKIDDAYIPEIVTFSEHKMLVYEIRGAYKMMNDLFYGPYIVYIYKDDFYRRYLFVQGFINDLNKPKRDEFMELEAIIKSVNFFED